MGAGLALNLLLRPSGLAPVETRRVRSARVCERRRERRRRRFVDWNVGVEGDEGETGGEAGGVGGAMKVIIVGLIG